jgi:hypothetical protein
MDACLSGLFFSLRRDSAGGSIFSNQIAFHFGQSRGRDTFRLDFSKGRQPCASNTSLVWIWSGWKKSLCQTCFGGGVSPFLFLNEPASEPPSLVGAQNLPRVAITHTSPNSTLVNSSQPRLSLLRSDPPAHTDPQTATSRPSTENTSFSLTKDDLTDPLNTDFFAIDLLVGSKARGPSFVARDSGPSAAPWLDRLKHGCR